MNYGSVCSGIEAASVAWHPLGWKPAWFAEIEPFPSAVLAHHWPEVPNLGDFTAIRHSIAAGELEAPDVLVGGTPCQAFSVAGLRQSLDDKRGQLTLEFVRLADAIDSARSFRGQRPVTVVWENVPGVLNTPDNAFGCFLAGLVGEDDPLEPPGGRWTNAGYVRGPQRAAAWRLLDAQYFGVAQRRRRVFVVASAGDLRPEQVLFEFDGVRRDTPPSRQQGQGTATDASEGFGTGSHWDGGPHPSLNQSNNIGGVGMSNQEIFSQRGAYLAPHPVAPCLTSGGRGVERTGETRGQDPVVATFQQSSMAGKGTIGWDESGIAKPCKTQSDGQMIVQGFQGDIARTLQARHDSSPCADRGMDVVAIQGTMVGRADHSGPQGKGYDESGVQFTLTKTDVHAIAFEPGVAGRLGGHCYYEVSGTLRKDAGDNQMAVAFSSKDHGSDASMDLSPTMRSMGHSESHANGGGQLAVAFQSKQSASAQAPSFDSISPTLDVAKAGGMAALVGMQVRRLTPTECERLQGFPDGHTLIPWRGRPAEDCPDGPRYKALGNSMAVPVMRWIGERVALHAPARSA